jgi:hypothetical protein
MIRQCILIAASLLIAGCSTLRTVPPISGEKGEKVVCILFDDTQFKTELTGKLTSALSKKGYRIVTGRVQQAKQCKHSDYGAIVYMTELWAWHTPWHAKRFFRRNDEAANIIFVITSGNPNVTIKKPFDAVTSASKLDRIEPVTKEILASLDRVVK